jgi:hypothetical protein
MSMSMDETSFRDRLVTRMMRALVGEWPYGRKKSDRLRWSLDHGQVAIVLAPLHSSGGQHRQCGADQNSQSRREEIRPWRPANPSLLLGIKPWKWENWFAR